MDVTSVCVACAQAAYRSIDDLDAPWITLGAYPTHWAFRIDIDQEGYEVSLAVVPDFFNQYNIREKQPPTVEIALFKNEKMVEDEIVPDNPSQWPDTAEAIREIARIREALSKRVVSNE